MVDIGDDFSFVILYTCNCATYYDEKNALAILFLVSLRAPTENGLSLMAQWMQCGLRI